MECYKKVSLLGIVMLPLVASSFVFAQTPDTLWTKTYGGTENDIGYSVQQTFDGGYIIVGETHSFGAGDADVWLLKTDENGDTVWTKTYGGDSADIGYSVQQTADSGYIIAGETRSFGAGGSDVYVIKTDSWGNTLWTQTYGDSFDDAAYAVQCIAGEDNFIITGYWCFPPHRRDVYLIKVGSDGGVYWTRTWGHHIWVEIGYAVQECTGGYIIAGTMGQRDGDLALLLKTDDSGNHLWNEQYVANGGAHTTEGVFNSVQPTTDGGFIAAGAPYVYLVKTDSMGDTLWEKRHGSGADGARSVHLTSDGCYIITGAADSDILLLKTDENGDTVWTNTYGTNMEVDEGYLVQQTSDDGYVIVGFTESYGAGESDVWLLKTEPDVGVEEHKPTQQVTTTLQIFPNPFSKLTKISFGIEHSAERIELKIYDATGRLVKSFSLSTPYCSFLGWN